MLEQGNDSTIRMKEGDHVVCIEACDRWSRLTEVKTRFEWKERLRYGSRCRDTDKNKDRGESDRITTLVPNSTLFSSLSERDQFFDDIRIAVLSTCPSNDGNASSRHYQQFHRYQTIASMIAIISSIRAGESVRY